MLNDTPFIAGQGVAEPICDDRLTIKLNADGQIVTCSPFISGKVQVEFKSGNVMAVLFECQTDRFSREFPKVRGFNVVVLPLSQFSNTFSAFGVNQTETGTSFARFISCGSLH